MSFSFCSLNLKGIDGLFSGVSLCWIGRDGQRDGIGGGGSWWVCGRGRTTARASLRRAGVVVKARH